ncbi:hypothetical protein C5B85_02535 [Pseudoclavibacter sp. AY1F1]|uniref:DUF4352 domain-containing protein n=1 Tax=Pseudoclavibacter sp. AY1F1 TaxID=2080583 RepID=UPI000CE8395E|nr:DUF4352 domain-containing protein [Pseudoclavibacter sp. AY1F1]PPF47168.1 hypothetical protein C5B85_02535 [Pseudoclavibacter sp. AY1F1]
MSQTRSDAERPAAGSRSGRWWRFAGVVVASVSVALAVIGYVLVSTRATDRGNDTLGAVEATPSWRGPDSELGTRGVIDVGGVQLTAGEVQCGLPSHDWQGGTARASGQFCVVDILLDNGNETPLPIAPSVFEMIDGDGTVTVAHEQLTAYWTDLPPGPPSLAELARDSATRIHLVFDVPTDAAGRMQVRFAPTAQLEMTI